jgi:hypothetical protein
MLLGNDYGWFNVPHTQLSRDVPTRWKSTFLMVKHLVEMRPVSYFFYTNSIESLTFHRRLIHL